MAAAGWMRCAEAEPADYSLFEGAYKGHELFQYPALNLEGRGQAAMKITTSGRGATLIFSRSLHVNGMNFPFSERTRFSTRHKFNSSISVPNFAHFGASSGHARVVGNRIRFLASYHMLGSAMSLVEDATITVSGRRLVYNVVVEFSSPAGLQRVATFEFIGLRKP
ncbi:MAG: hypothetical protein ACREKL_12815 [Chthoniobacterales bacterium]